MATTLTPNMNLPVPIVGQESGPQYATDINTCMSILDAHNHTPGSGVSITPDAIDINSTLTLNSNDLTDINALILVSQAAPLAALSPYLDCIYVADVDLYFNDGDGNQIRITQNGGVVGSPGAITGLVAPASASYVAADGTFVWQSDVNTSANMDFGSAILRNSTVNSFGLTLNPPNAMGADITITLPSPPVSTQFMTMDLSGNILVNTAFSKGLTNANIANATITQGLLAAKTSGTTVAAGGVAISGSSGTYSTSSGALSLITNFTLTITTTGRPVKLSMQNDASGLNGQLHMTTPAGNATSTITMKRDAVIISEDDLQLDANTASGDLTIPPSSWSFLDMGVNGVPGTYVYTLFASTSNFFEVRRAVFVAYEI